MNEKCACGGSHPEYKFHRHDMCGDGERGNFTIRQSPAAPKVVDSKEGQDFEEWWTKYLSGREIDPFPEKSALWNAKQAAWSAWHSKKEQTG